MRRPSRGLIAYLAIFAAIILLAYMIGGGGSSNGAEITYNDLLKKIDDGRVEYVAIRERDLFGLYYDSERPVSSFPERYDFSCVISDDFWNTLYTMTHNETGKAKEDISENDLVFNNKN